MSIERIKGSGWVVLLGGGEFSFGQTQESDRAWLAKVAEGAKVGFLPTASGSTEYGEHFTGYLREAFDRPAENLPIYRPRDAKRGKNSRRIAECGAVYLGGGVVDHLADAFFDTPASEALVAKLREGGVIVAIAAAASFLGRKTRSPLQQEILPGLGWLVGGAVAPNFDPRDERLLRELVSDPVCAGASACLPARPCCSAPRVSRKPSVRSIIWAERTTKSKSCRAGSPAIPHKTRKRAAGQARPTDRRTNMSLTLGIIKPDAVAAGSAGAMLAQLQAAGFKIRAIKMLRLTEDQARGFYAVHSERPFFGDLVKFMTSGPAMPLVLEADDAVPALRKEMGATNSKEAEEGTIRNRFGTDIERNAMHGSDSDDNAKIEIGFFFSQHDLIAAS